ncbi:MAG: hypothetical protein ABSH36_00510 [Solirubrobacteraceae bacterium]
MLFFHSGSLARVEAHQDPNIGRILQPRDFSRLAETLAGGYRVAIDCGGYTGVQIDTYTRMITKIRGILNSDTLRGLAPHCGLPSTQAPDPNQPNPFGEPPSKTPPPANLVWVVVPDVREDAAHTFLNFQWLAPLMSDLPLAYVVQDGSGEIGIPFDTPNLRCLFLAGSDTYKQSLEMQQIAAEGKARGLWIHGAPCNSEQRAQLLASLGCDSFDGTGASKFPGLIPRYLRWAGEAEATRPPARTTSTAGGTQ